MGALAGMMGGAGAAGAAGAGAAGAGAAAAGTGAAGAAAGGSSLLSGLGQTMMAAGSGKIGGMDMSSGSETGSYDPKSLRQNQSEEQRKEALMMGLKSLSR